MRDSVIYKNQNSEFSVQSLYCVGGYVTYEVKAVTNGFLGTSNFCIEETKVAQYVNSINSMIRALNGELRILDCESDSFIELKFVSFGELYVCGQIGGSHEDNFLNFKFRVDQTILIGMKDRLLDYCGEINL